jgi:hypothetical protein
MVKGWAMAACAVVLLTSGVSWGKSAGIADYRKSEGPMKILMMTPDVDVSVITAGGMREPNLEWTQRAKVNLLKALEGSQAKVGGTLVPYDETKLAPGEAAQVTDLLHLNTAVTFAIATHTVLPGADKLPTKKGNFDWSLGPSTAMLKQTFGADHALFLIAYDSFSSAGRVAANVMGMAGCVIGICIIPQGGRQDALASLVNLETGQVVWMSYVGKQAGDIREEAGAQLLIDQLVAQMPGAPPPQAKKKR